MTPAALRPSSPIADRWTAYTITVLAVCILGFAFDIYEGTIIQLVTPLLIKEWGIKPATIGYIIELTASTGVHGEMMDPAISKPYEALARWQAAKSQ